jgi:flagellar hook assembly protein FlgD
LITGVEQRPAPLALPTKIVLGQNFPNPFNSSTIITFVIPEVLANSNTQLALYDVQGRLVKRLLSQKLPAGNFAARWDGTNQAGIVVASGVYFYHLSVGNQRQIGKMSFVK